MNCFTRSDREFRIDYQSRYDTSRITAVSYCDTFPDYHSKTPYTPFPALVITGFLSPYPMYFPGRVLTLQLARSPFS